MRILINVKKLLIRETVLFRVKFEYINMTCSSSIEGIFLKASFLQ